MIPRLSRSEALKLLRKCLESGIVEYHPHFALRCRDRGIDPLDAQYVLRKGVIYDEAELDVRFQEWRYKVEGKAPDAEKNLKVVITFLERDEVLVITVMLDNQ
jgi:hypothetical protein